MHGRIYALDALRGFFILYVVWLHALTGVVFGNDASALSEVRPWLLMLLAPLALVATWAPIFALISGAAHGYVIRAAFADTAGREERLVVLGDVLRRGVSISLLLYLLSIINMTCMHHAMPFAGAVRHTMLTGAVMEGRFFSLPVVLLFYNDALFLISISGLLLTLVFCAAVRVDLQFSLRRCYLAFGAMAVVLFAGAPLIHARLDAAYFQAIAEGRYLAAYGLKLLVGPQLSTFPYAAYGFIGAMVGVALGDKRDWMVLRRWGYGVALLLLAAGGTLVLAQGLRAEELVQHPFPMKLHCVNAGCMLGLMLFLLDNMDFCEETLRPLVARRSLWLRRMGMAALSVYLLESFAAAVASRLYVPLWTDSGAFPRHGAAIVIFLVLLVVSWVLSVNLWARVQFKYGFEWLLVTITGRIRGVKSQRLRAGAA